MCMLGCNENVLLTVNLQESSKVIVLEETLKDPVLTGSLSSLHPMSTLQGCQKSIPLNPVREKAGGGMLGEL